MFKAKFAIIKCVTALMISLSSVITLVAYAAADSKNIITVVDGAETKEISTFCDTAEEILAEQSIVLKNADTAELTLSDGIGTLKINRAFPVHITVGGNTVSVDMQKGTVATALSLANVALDEYDLCNKKTDEVLSKETYIDIINVDFETESYEEVIPFTTKIEYSDKLNKGEKNVIKGSNGTKLVTVKKTLKDGAVSSKEVISETVVKEATPQTTIIGTKETGKVVNTISTLGSVKVNADGVPLEYKKSMTFRASAYTSPKGAKCSTGVVARPGYIAVNPNVIPYGTKMYIVSADGKYTYGYAIAADTGGFAKKNPYMVDLYFNTESECINFGIRNVKIYVLE